VSGVDVVESGKMTKDLAVCIHGDGVKREHYLSTEEFLEEIAEGISQRMTH